MKKLTKQQKEQNTLCAEIYCHLHDLRTRIVGTQIPVATWPAEVGHYDANRLAMLKQAAIKYAGDTILEILDKKIAEVIQP